MKRENEWSWSWQFQNAAHDTKGQSTFRRRQGQRKMSAASTLIPPHFTWRTTSGTSGSIQPRTTAMVFQLCTCIWQPNRRDFPLRSASGCTLEMTPLNFCPTTTAKEPSTTDSARPCPSRCTMWKNCSKSPSERKSLPSSSGKIWLFLSGNTTTRTPPSCTRNRTTGHSKLGVWAPTAC